MLDQPSVNGTEVIDLGPIAEQALDAAPDDQVRVRTDGHRFDVVVSPSPGTGSRGEAAGVSFTVRDVTATDLFDAFLGALDDLGDATEVPAVRVLLVDDHTMFAELAARILDRVPGLAVVGGAASVAEAIVEVASTTPDVVVSEWCLPDGTAADLAERFRETHPATVVVVLTDAWDERLLSEAVQAGCAGCIGKHQPFEDLTDAIRAAAAGDSLVSPGHLAGVLRRMRPRPKSGHAATLTGREREVLGLIAQGLSTDAIAFRLDISAHTVRNHSQRVITKLGAHSRLEAVATGVRAGLVAR